MKKLLLLGMVFVALGCGVDDSGSSDNVSEIPATQPATGKADDAQQNPGNSSLADEFDYCGEFELYNDGTCHRFCFEEDPDCEGIEEEETDVPNPFDDCSDDDSDCDEEDSSSEPSLSLEDVERMCSDFELAEDIVRDLASTLCMERDNDEEAFSACVELCLEAAQ